MPKKTPTRAASAASAAAAAIQRRRTTAAVQRLQNRLARFSCRIFGQSTFGPMPPRIAGVRVRVVSTLASGMSAPP